MQTQVSVFQFQANQVRVEIQNGEPWFCLKDVTDILAIKNHNEISTRLKANGVTKIQLTDSLQRKQEATFINEPNLYRVIFRSNKAEAVKFQDWIFEEVIPQIRQTGSYSAAPKTTVSQRTPLRDAVNLLVSKKGLSYSEAYQVVHQRFGVESIEDLSQGQVFEAVEYVHRMILEGEVLDKDSSLNCLLHHADYLTHWVLNYAPHLRAFNNAMAGELIGRATAAYMSCYGLARQIGFKLQSHEYWQHYPYGGDLDTVCAYREQHAV